MPYLKFIVALAAGLAAAAAASSQQPFPTAVIEIGTLRGTQRSLPQATAPVNQFLGVPFAQSPPQRFSPPQPALSSYGRLINATTLTPACIQQFPYPIEAQQFIEAVYNQPPPPESEDCLYLNIYAPSTPAPAGGRAVLFWIYGGGLSLGYAGLPDYDGSAFAAYQDVIVVTVNFRSNIFGFPGSPQLPLKENNLGFLDQRFALEWVQRNIAAFGGDKDKVTVFGQSSGAGSIDSLITSYPVNSKTPFRAAILESGTVTYQSQPAGDRYLPWNTLIESLNCSSSHEPSKILACARAAPASTIKSIIEQAALTFDALPDNYTRYEKPALRRQYGQFAKVPVLAGTVAQEARVYFVGDSDLDGFLNQTFGATAPQIIPSVKAAFPVGTTAGVDTAYDRIAEIYTLLLWRCPNSYFVNASLAAGIPTWRYLYNSSFPNINYADDSGSYHASELDLVFGSYRGGPINPVTKQPLGLRQTQLPATAQEIALSKFTNKAWADFAKNPLAGPGWKQASTSNGNNVGVLGGPNGQTGVTLARQKVIDKHCELFIPQYRVANPGIPIPPAA